MSALTADQKTVLKGIVETARAIRDAIQELGSVPEGHLYAHLMGQMNLVEFTFYIDLLVKAGEITRTNHLLSYVEEAANGQ